MFKHTKLVSSSLAAALLLAACGSSSKTTSSSTGSTPAAPSGASSGVEVKAAENSTLGKTVLVDSRGMTLYALSGERNGKFICTSAACVGVWHPVTVASGSSPSGVESLGTVKRPDGTEQVTYKGAPLYTFAQDKKAGDVKGQGFKDVGTWSAVGAGSTAHGGSKSTSTAPSSSGGGGGYGY
jgi:predicted lipoprotein with Yx(FWY)xxD motif